MDTKSFFIGSVEIKNPLVLAPLAAVNCASFRILCKRHGAALVYTQMIDVDIFLADHKKHSNVAIIKHLNVHDIEHPISAQIIGNKIETIVEAAKIIEKYVDIIDLNIGCIEGDYLGKKCGAYLLQFPHLIERILRKLVPAVKVPVTVKIRSGWDDSHLNAVDIAKLCEKCGVKAIAIHARTRKQNYMGKADWNVIREVKAAVNIPVIGNGDIITPNNVITMIGQTKCDAVMIGRTAMGDPTIFSRSLALLKDKINMIEPSALQKKELMLDFLSTYHKFEQRRNLGEMIDHLIWLSSGLKNSSMIRNKFKTCRNEDELKAVISMI